MSIQSIQSSLQHHELNGGEEIQVAFINITATQLKKSIMDATKPVDLPGSVDATYKAFKKSTR